VELVADRKLMDPDAPRGGLVEVTLRNGKTVSHLTRHPPGTKENPLDNRRPERKGARLNGPSPGRGANGSGNSARERPREHGQCAKTPALHDTSVTCDQ